MHIEDVVATLRVMRKQEESFYRVSDYFAKRQRTIGLASPSTCTSIDANSPLSLVDMDSRYKMAEWCYQVIDFCKFHRETVSIAMSHLDRFLGTRIGREALGDRRLFQLCAMTCLYTAVKVHEPQAIDPKSFATLSRGDCTADEIQAMESITLDALEWRMNPPTAVAFLQYFLELIPKDMMTPTLRETIYDLASFQTELAVSEYDFVTVQASAIAFSALMNAMECIDESMAHYLRQTLSDAVNMDCDSPAMFQTQQRLYEIITKRPESLITAPATPLPMNHKPSEGHSSVHVSPRSIVGACRHGDD
jgi:hypothetical protein